MLPVKKKAAVIRLGDLIRVMWKVPGKTTGKCKSCEWTPSAGIGYPNICRESRKHTRGTGHITRVASIEVTEYRVKG